MTGIFITFEGGEGSGKSTQLSLLGEAFEAAGIPYITTREPGGCESAERIRTLLVSGDHAPWDPVAETLLFYAARMEHVTGLVKPALAEGKVVLCDRFADSTQVYQGIGKGLSEEYVLMLHRLLLGNFAPDLTLVLDIDPTEGLARAADRRGSETRFESMEIDFHRKVRAGFLAIAERESQRCRVLDAAEPARNIHARVVTAINTRFGFTMPTA